MYINFNTTITIDGEDPEDVLLGLPQAYEGLQHTETSCRLEHDRGS